MYLLGAYLPDNKLVRIALTSFYGISHATARRLCARLQLHERAKVSSLTEAQITHLSAYISSPSSIPARSDEVTSPFPGGHGDAARVKAPTDDGTQDQTLLPESQRSSPQDDSLRSLVLESDLRRQLLANLNHHRTIGSYVGRRHVAGLPVRGQRTKSNAITAGKLNRIERRGMATYASPPRSASSTSVSDLIGPLSLLRFHHS